MVDDAQVRAIVAAKLRTKLAVRKEIAALPRLIQPGEDILTLASGVYEGRNGLLVATTQRLVFLDLGLVREHVEEFPIERIQSVQTRSGLVTGQLTIFASGNNATITNVAPKERVAEIADIVRRARAQERSAPAPPRAVESPIAPLPAAGATDPAARLERLAGLKAAGLVSEEEFAAQRARIIDEL